MTCSNEISWFKELQASVEERVLTSRYVKVQVLSVLDVLMTTTYWLVATLTLINTAPQSVTAVVLALSVASLLRPVAEPPMNHGVMLLLRTYMRLGRKGAIRFGKLYWSSVALNALLAGVVGATLLVSWAVTHANVFLWASMLMLSFMASLPAQLPALLLDDTAYSRVVLLSNFTRYALLYVMWRSAVDPLSCFESFLIGSFIALSIGVGYAAWSGIGPRVWDAGEVKNAVKLGMPAWLERVGTTVAKWGAVTAIVVATYFGLVSPYGPGYVFIALLVGNIITALLGGWVNIFLIARDNQYLLPARVVGLASGTAFPFAVYFTLSTLRMTGDVGSALLAGALLASLPADLLGSLLSGKAYATTMPNGVRVLRMYALAQFLTPLIAYSVYLGSVFTLGRTPTSIAVPYLAIRLLSLIITRSASRASLRIIDIVIAGVIPMFLSIGLALTLPRIYDNVLNVTVLSIVLTLLSYALVNILGKASR